MRCRRASSAAQSLQHLWISDSLLSEAFRRFARVSHTQAQHRRHGSNIPGPLEARKRLSRRRMGMMTLDHVRGGLPPVEEAGVLFSFGRKGPPIGSEFAKAWKYQAPYSPDKLARERAVEQDSQSGKYSPFTWSDGSFWDLDAEPQQQDPELQVPQPQEPQLLEVQLRESQQLHPQQVPPEPEIWRLEYFPASEQPLEPETSLFEYQPLAEQPIERESSKLQELISSLVDGEEVTEQWLESVSQILKTTAAESGAQELISVIKALQAHAVPLDFWETPASILKHKVVRGLAPNYEIVDIFKLILERIEDWESVSVIFASEFRHIKSNDTLLGVLEYVVTSPKQKAKTNFWLGYLRSYHGEIRHNEFSSSSCRKFYGLLAQHIRPSDPCTAYHFGRMRRTDCALILLNFYLPVWISAAGGSDQNRDGDIDIEERDAHSITENSEHYEAFNSARGPDLRESVPRNLDFEPSEGIYIPFSDAPAASNSTTTDFRSRYKLARSIQQRLDLVKVRLQSVFRIDQDPFSDHKMAPDAFAIAYLANLLHEYKLPYEQLLDEVFEIYMQTETTTRTKNLFFSIKEQKRCEIPIAVGGRLVQYFVASDDVDYAFYVFYNVSTIPLLPYAELLLKLIERGRTHGAKIFEMLNRYSPEERLALGLRQNPHFAFKPEHVDLVHELAYAFASSEHLSPRTAFRRVWECFRWLRDRSAPVQPLISRALVKAGISRALKERQRLSKEQVKYIISIVELIEGPEVAKEVDRIVWESWNWHLERQWSLGTPKPEKGPEGLRYYDKPTRLWIKGGGRIFNPTPEPVDITEEEAVNQQGDVESSYNPIPEPIDGKEAHSVDHESDVESTYMPFSEIVDSTETQPIDHQSDVESKAEEIVKLSEDSNTFRLVENWTSAAEMEEFVSDVYGPVAKTDPRSPEDYRIVDSDDAEISLAEMNEALSELHFRRVFREPKTKGKGERSVALIRRVTEDTNEARINGTLTLTKTTSPLRYHSTGRNDSDRFMTESEHHQSLSFDPTSTIYWRLIQGDVGAQISVGLAAAFQSLQLESEKPDTIVETSIAAFEDAWPAWADMKEVPDAPPTLSPDFCSYNPIEIVSHEPTDKPRSSPQQQRLEIKELSLFRHLQLREEPSNIRRLEFRKELPTVKPPEISPFARALAASEDQESSKAIIRIVEVPDTIGPEILYDDGALAERIEPVNFSRCYVREAKEKVYWRSQ